MYPDVIDRAQPESLDRLSPIDRGLFGRFGWGADVPLPYTQVHHAVESWAAAQPNAVAAEHAGRSITYGELDRQADRLAAVLAAHGVRRGDQVALFVRRSIPMVVGILAILKAGAAYVPQDIGLTPAAQLRHVIRTAATRVILTTSADGAGSPVPPGHLRLDIDEVMARPLGPARGRPDSTEPDDGCYVLFTSGTTGRPNGVKVTHRNVCNILLTGPGGLGMGPGVRVAHLLNIAFDMAAWEILGCLSHGSTLLIRDRDLAATACRADVVIATPTVLGRLDPARCAGVRTVAVAGEPCPRPLADRWARTAAFYNCCGPTETTIVNTMGRHRTGAPLTIGRPTPNNTVYVLDGDRRPCPIGEVGEMWAGGDCVSAGYLGNPELNAERYAPDPFRAGDRLMFRTRDLVRWTPDGALEHLGRTDDQVKVRGFRVELDGVSAVLEAMPGCERAITLKLDERTLVSFVSPSGVDTAAAREAVAAALPYYCVPAAVHAVDRLPQTARGKIDKAALLTMAGGGK
jgi:amino acid adenylation domain-containing protein